VPAVGAVVFRDDAVLLVKRGAEPNLGRWSLPGGSLEAGETVEAAAVRETREETRVEVRPLRVLDVRDFIERKEGRVRWHYVLIDILCECVQGDPFPATDAENARLIPLGELGEYEVVPAALEVLQMTSARRIVSPDVTRD
jgi:ADP-ribose pyrophosphatase YjhB (NUDIX family)